MSSAGMRRLELDREDIISGLRELIVELQSRGSSARISIVGGAAIVLTLHADRRSTVDIDGPLEPADRVLDAASVITARRGWRADWINDSAKIFLPSGFGSRVAEWTTIYDHRGIHIEAATPDTLLAMKLNAAQRRGNREAEDLAVLLPLCGIDSPDAAEEHFHDYYPGDDFTERTYRIVERLLEIGAAPPVPPRLPVFDIPD
jgi:hypothetical protein